MEQYGHIVEMETIRVQQEERLKEMNTLMDQITAGCGEYQALIEYYYSEQRNRDLEDDAKGLIPEDLERGVLSEDGLYDLIGDYRDTAIRMLEVAVQMLKA